MQLVCPSLAYEKSFSDAIKEMQNTQEIGFWTEIGSPKNTADYIRIRSDHSKGKSLPESWVPATTFWLVDGDIFIGETTIRHILTEFLLNVGGQIGYWIRPSERKQGYGTKILQMALHEAKEMDIARVRITCDETNTGSQKIIEANGGKLDGSTDMGENLPKKLLFWINLKN